MTERPARALLQRFGTFMDGFSACFSRAPQRTAASQYLEGLFNDSERKSMQAMHGRLSDPVSYQALQHFVTHSPWKAAAVWAHLRSRVPLRRGILALDDTGFPKQGHRSVGVKRQYCGTRGKVCNCQIAVSSVLIGGGLAWPLTFELYLPDEWLTEEARRAAGIPETVIFREKWRIALAQVRTVLAAGFALEGVVVDGDYGSTGPFRHALERLGLRYGVAIRGDLLMGTRGARPQPVTALADAPPAAAWQVVSWADGTKGPLSAEFLALRVRPDPQRGERWLLCERGAADGKRRFYLLNLPDTATLTALVRLARSRWPIEQQYRELKDELGIDHFEGRSYRGWTHHTVLTAVAFTFLQLERRRQTVTPRLTLPAIRLWIREIIGVLYIIHTRRLMRMMASFQRNPPLRR